MFGREAAIHECVHIFLVRCSFRKDRDHVTIYQAVSKAIYVSRNIYVSRYIYQPASRVSSASLGPSI